MRYAAISDVHGNLPVLELILADAQKWGAEGYLLLGDYVGEFPWPNEVITLLKSLPNAHVVRGNREDYAEKMSKEDPMTWTWQQLETLYWNMRELTEENLAYLLMLPKVKKIEVEGHKLFLSHRLEDFLSVKTAPLMMERHFARLNGNISHQEIDALFLKRMKDNNHILNQFKELKKGYYFFGHNHLPWIGFFDNKHLLDAGAVGVPLDGDTRTSYIRAEFTKDTVITEIRRLNYHKDKLTAQIRASALYQTAGDWAQTTIADVYAGKNAVMEIFNNAPLWAEEWNMPYTEPMSNELWQKVIKRWQNLHLSEND